MIRYQSPLNSYRGVLYGTSSMTIYSPSASVVLHTDSSNLHTMEELMKFVDTFPETHSTNTADDHTEGR